MADYQFSLWDSACIVHVRMYYACDIHVTCMTPYVPFTVNMHVAWSMHLTHTYDTHVTVDMKVACCTHVSWVVLCNSATCIYAHTFGSPCPTSLVLSTSNGWQTQVAPMPARLPLHVFNAETNTCNIYLTMPQHTWQQYWIIRHRRVQSNHNTSCWFKGRKL